jgi:hypothetical protein
MYNKIMAEKNNQVCRYNLAYINARLFAGDHGRVLGFDNAHDYHHRHLYGVVSAFDFRSFEAAEEMFEAELRAILIEARK